MGRTAQPLAERFWPRVDRSGGATACWMWTGAMCNGRYGAIRTKKAYRVFSMIPVHHAAWVLTNGPIPEGMELCHSCDNTRCCNPTHLFLGTRLDNEHDKDSKGRRPRGGSCVQSLLTDAQANAIRSGKGSVASLARKHSVPYSVAWDIVHGRTYK